MNRQQNCKILFLLMFIVIFVFCINIVGCGKQSHTISGRLENNEIWSGRIRLRGDVIVPQGVKLTIEPGTLITYTSKKIEGEIQIIRNILGNSVDILKAEKIEIIIEGELEAKGTPHKNIYFGLKGRDNPFRGGIVFLGEKKDSCVKFCEIREHSVGIRCNDTASPEISSNVIMGCEIGAVGLWDFASPEIIGNKVINNKYGIGI